jgi:hypothetical protein
VPPVFFRRFHAFGTVAWLVLMYPTVEWWHDSVLFVGLVSCYANAVGHFSGYQGTRAEAANTKTGDGP